MKNTFLIIFCLFVFGIISKGQTMSQQTESIGTPILRIYANYHAGLNSADQNNSAFELNRAYVGYDYKIDSDFSARVILDIGSSADDPALTKIKRYTYVKNAFMQYRKNQLTLQFGIFSTEISDPQIKFWNHRYISNSLLLIHKFGSSADLGIKAKYQLTNKLSIDLCLLNGEGFKSLQQDNTYLGTAGITATPLKGLTARFYTDFTAKSENQSTYVLFIGYAHKKLFRIGGEVSRKKNMNWVYQQNAEAVSAYGYYNILKKWQIFGRYDYIKSNTLDQENIAWNYTKDGSYLISGIQFQPIKKVRLALNHQYWSPRNNQQDKRSYIYCNLEVKF